MTRPTVDEYFIQMARIAATRGTCSRRQVGCVIVDKNNRIMSTGYNGVMPGAEHCTDSPCPGAKQKSGCGLDECEAIHAEINALAFCSDVMKINTVYCTLSPCVQCIKSLLTTSAERIVFLEEYSNLHNKSEKLWKQSGRKWEKFQ